MKLVIKSSRWKYFLLLLLSVAFVAAGVLLVLVSPAKWVGWMNIVFFGACAAVFIWQILDSRPRLTIDESGVNDRTLGLGTIPWEDIEEAYVQSISGNDFICLRLRNADAYFERLSPVKKSMVKANEALGFTPFSLNISGISASTEEVFELVMRMCESRRTEG
ncbi:MAG: STM3941 family protein [Syntrophobacteraceae bacterium]